MFEWIFLNDRFVRRDEAKISVFDHGFLYGDGVFETLRIYKGRCFQLQRHMARLRRSCELIDLNLPISDAEWPGLLAETVRRNELSDASVRITVSRGEGEVGLDASLCQNPTVVIMARPIASYSLELREQGVDLELVNTRRNPISAQSPEIKSLSFLNNILAKQEATRAGCFDALMVNVEGFLTECTTSNVFFIRGMDLCTPAAECGILHGVTRAIILRLGREEGLSVSEGHYSPADLFAADECFMTNTSMEVMPVRQVGGRRIGPRCPGAITDQLHRAFQENIDRFMENPI